MIRTKLLLALAFTAALVCPIPAQNGPNEPQGPPTFGVEDNPWRPYQVRGVLRADPTVAAATGTVVTVPPGKLFVIDFMTVDVTLPIGQEPDQSILGIRLPGGSDGPSGSDSLVFHSFKLERMGAANTGFFTRWIFTGKVRLYATDEIFYRVQRNIFLGNAGNITATVTCSGHLVDY